MNALDAAVVGIDPGVTGAVAFLTADGRLLAVLDMPVDTVQVGKHSRSRLNRHRALAMFGGPGALAGATAFAEEPTFRPMKRRDPKTGIVGEATMGAAGAGAFGRSYEIVVMAAVAAGAALVEVAVQDWRRGVGLRGDKDEARRMAGNLFPAWAATFAKKSAHGRAEACLIGWFGARELRGDKAA